MLKYEAINNAKKDWVVFIHGIGGSTKTWKRQIEKFSKKYNLLLLDLPGHGKNAANVINKVDLKKLDKGICDTLNYLKIKSAHFVSMSMGTIVAAQFAAIHPNRVKKLVMGGSAISVTGVQKHYIKIANRMKRLLPYKFLCNFFAWFMLPKRNHKTSRTIFLREAAKLSRETMLAWIEYLKFATKPEEVARLLDETGKKILFVSGNEDHCFLGGVKSFVKNIRNAKLKIIRKCGHVCTIERAEDFNNIAIEYLSAS